MTEHNHDHDHEGHEHITLVDEQGNETLYEILLTVDGQETDAEWDMIEEVFNTFMAEEEE